MKIKEVSVERKFNLGNFESLGVHVTADIEDSSESNEEIIDKACKELYAAIKQTVEKLKGK